MNTAVSTHLSRGLRAPQRVAHWARAKAQAGIVLMVALITLVVLSLGAVALFRSTDMVNLQAGAMSFMMDHNNKADLCVRRAVSWMTDPGSGLNLASGADQPAFNYFGRQFTPNQTDAKYGLHSSLVSSTSNTWMGAAPNIDAGGGVTVNCTIERLCTRLDPADRTHCEMAALPRGGQGIAGSQQPTVGSFPAFRVTTRVDGVRGTQFLQVTIAPTP
jgi:type IV pilus assembly protein PilX